MCPSPHSNAIIWSFRRPWPPWPLSAIPALRPLATFRPFQPLHWLSSASQPLRHSGALPFRQPALSAPVPFARRRPLRPSSAFPAIRPPQPLRLASGCATSALLPLRDPGPLQPLTHWLRQDNPLVDWNCIKFRATETTVPTPLPTISNSQMQFDLASTSHTPAATSALPSASQAPPVSSTTPANPAPRPFRPPHPPFWHPRPLRPLRSLRPLRTLASRPLSPTCARRLCHSRSRPSCRLEGSAPRGEALSRSYAERALGLIPAVSDSLRTVPGLRTCLHRACRPWALFHLVSYHIYC